MSSNIINPLTGNSEPIRSVLRSIASQGGNDGYPYDQMQDAADYIGELEEKISENHDWHCGCGHWNGANLSVCAQCGENPGGGR